MDWERFEALCAAHYQHEAARSTIMPLGTTNGFDVRIYSSRKNIHPDILVRCTAVSRNRISGGRVAMFASGLLRQGIPEGIYVARAGFSADAITMAAQSGITLVTPQRLLARLQQLPLARQSELIRVATIGEWEVPTCPKCMVKMTRRQRGDLLYWRCPNAGNCGQRRI